MVDRRSARRNITGISGGQRAWASLFSRSLSDFDNNVYRYRYQLEAFVDKVRGRTPEHWYDAQDSIANMEWVEAVYKEVSRRFFLVGLGTNNRISQTGLGSRPASTAEVPV